VDVQFANPAGETLAGRIEVPAGGAPRAWAIFAHCFTCTSNIRAARRISRALADAGYGVLRFDFTGLGESEGDFADTSFTGNVQDLCAAADYLAQHHSAPTLLVGHSLGGAAVLDAASRLPSVKAVATIAAPSRADHVLHLVRGAEKELETAGEAEVDIGGRPFRLKKGFVDDARAHGLPDSLADLRKALLILHAPLDTIVSIDNAAELYKAARHPKSFVSLDDADHLLSRPEDGEYAAGVIAAWARRYVPQLDAKEERKPEGAVVARTGPGSYRTELTVSGHALVADEPASVGGSGTGPTPYGLLSAALAACTTMTLRMYFSHKNIEAGDVIVTVDHDKIHAKDCAECESRSGKVDRFRRTVAVRGLDPSLGGKVLEIADKCPVHRTLHSEARVETKLAGSGD
jgi:putative redox protein